MKAPAYPLYRKYKNNKSYFKITSASEFEEVQVMGSRYTLHLFKASILPDRNFMHDMTFDYHANWEEITEQEYLEVKQKAG
jgi:hypothetical protein